jgi:threonine dehydrogenase-like Zn-dependent dehydrogenase
MYEGRTSTWKLEAEYFRHENMGEVVEVGVTNHIKSGDMAPGATIAADVKLGRKVYQLLLNYEPLNRWCSFMVLVDRGLCYK